jgi:hypothetical protein
MLLYISYLILYPGVQIGIEYLYPSDSCKADFFLQTGWWIWYENYSIRLHHYLGVLLFQLHDIIAILFV